MKSLRWFLLGCCASLLAIGTSGGSDFKERLAAWQNQGGAPPAAAPAPARPSPAPRTAPPRPALPAPQPDHFVSPEPMEAYAPYAAGSCGPACGTHGACGGCDLCSGCGDYGAWCCNTLVWAKFDVLLWWRQGRDLPPLVTTDPVTEASTTAGILPDAQILFGGNNVSSDMAAGGRFDIGTWTDPRQCWGFGWRFFGLGKDAREFNADSLDEPVLAIPFADVTNNQNDALLVAFPGLRSGQVNFSASSEVLGNDIYGRFLLCRDHDSRLDFVTGWHFSRINDNLELRSRSTITEVGGNIPLGTVTQVTDQFDARNEFHGGILGLIWERQCGCWTTTALARTALGNMNERMEIRGSTRVTLPGQTAQVTNGGLLTADSNIGTFTRSEFTAVSELGLTLGYRWANCTQFTVGYTFMYWNDVTTPGDAIDPSIGTSSTAGTRPQFTFRHSDYWVQGLHLGLVREF